jgi:asparagine synthase (glutamine-hydrolysing)
MLERMRSALGHRGPDDRGIEFVASQAAKYPVGLAHTRLSVIDVSPAGHQPMAGTDTWIVYNGEIYNHLKLRSELSERGVQYRTHSDTETILRAYETWGPAAVDHLHGMFAFCVVDPHRGIVWLCRDRMGQKPIYLARMANGALIFASEVRALLAGGDGILPREANPSAIVSFLAQGMVCGTSAIADGIRLLPRATTLTTDFDGKELKVARYWTVPSSPGESIGYGRAVRDVGSALRDSVTEHLLADVPLGLFLSGGIDSTALATVATEVTTAKIHTITIGFDDPEADESADAEAVARELGTEHRTVRLGGDEMLADVDEVFRAMDQPTVDGFNTYFVSRAARRAGLTVAVSGVGGDELFGGYASFRDVPRAVHIARVARRISFAAPLLARMAGMAGGRLGIKAAEMISRQPDALGAYLLRRELFLERERRELCATSAGTEPATGVPLSVLDDLRSLVDGRDMTNTVSRLELGLYMSDMLLRDADVFSMASGLELRAPLLDDRVVEVASRMPGRWKRMRRYPKALLVDAAGPRLPRRVVGRPKRGFAFPWDPWLRGPLQSRAQRALDHGDLWRAIGLAPDAPSHLWERFCKRDPRVVALQVVALWVLAEYVSRTGLRVSR